jgi:hypothetical protein
MGTRSVDAKVSRPSRPFLAHPNLVKNVHGVAKVAELDGDEVGYLVGKIAEIKRQR